MTGPGTIPELRAIEDPEQQAQAVKSATPQSLISPWLDPPEES